MYLNYSRTWISRLQRSGRNDCLWRIWQLCWGSRTIPQTALSESFISNLDRIC